MNAKPTQAPGPTDAPNAPEVPATPAQDHTPSAPASVHAPNELHAHIDQLNLPSVLADLARELRPQAGREGKVADYIPALAGVNAAHFGLALHTAHGTACQAGEGDAPFSIQSISKALVFALVCEELGHEEVRRRSG